MPSSAWRSTLFPYTTLFRSDRKSTRLNSSHDQISYAVFCLKKKKILYATALGFDLASITTTLIVASSNRDAMEVLKKRGFDNTETYARGTSDKRDKIHRLT